MKDKHIFSPIILESTVVVCDPCYQIEDDYLIDNVKEGEYIPIVEYGTEGRVKSLTVIHKKYEPVNFKLHNINVDVDSGQAGIFSKSIYPEGESTGEYSDKETFYGKCCDATLGESYDNLDIWYRVKNEIETPDDLWEKAMGKKYWMIKYERYLENLTKESSDKFEQSLEEIRDSDKSKEEIDDLIKERISYRNFSLDFERKHIEIYEYYIKHNEMPPEPKHYDAGTVDGKGIVSRTGWGDGTYPCYIKRNSKNQVVGIKIKYM